MSRIIFQKSYLILLPSYQMTHPHKHPFLHLFFSKKGCRICFDDTVLFSGDCLAVNEQGGYSFFDFFTQFPDMNKKSLLHLQKIVSTIQPRYVCTGHSGIRKYSPDIFAHAHESAQLSLKKPFDPYAPYDAFNQNTH